MLYVEVRTLDDIARFSCRFDSSARELISSKNGKKQRVIGLAEGMDEKVIALYTDIDLDADTIRYVYGEGSRGPGEAGASPPASPAPAGARPPGDAGPGIPAAPSAEGPTPPP